MKKRIALILLVSIVSVVLTACIFRSDERIIEDRLDAFADAYNAGDMEAVLECLDAKTRNTYKAALNIGNELIGLTGFGVDIADMFGLGVGIMSGGDVIQFSDVEIMFYSSNEAYVTVTMGYDTYDGAYSERVKFAMVKEKGDWYICG